MQVVTFVGFGQPPSERVLAAIDFICSERISPTPIDEAMLLDLLHLEGFTNAEITEALARSQTECPRVGVAPPIVPMAPTIVMLPQPTPPPPPATQVAPAPPAPARASLVPVLLLGGLLVGALAVTAYVMRRKKSS